MEKLLRPINEWRKKVDLNSWKQEIVAFLCGAYILYGLPQMYIMYRDETINVWKAKYWHIFDYSLRPLSFLINSIFIRWTSLEPTALAVLASICVFSGVLLLTRLFKIKDSYDLLALIVAISSCTLLFTWGLQGMVNSVAFLFICLYLFFYLYDFNKKIKRIILGTLLFCGVCTHPSVNYFFIPFYGLRLLQEYRKKGFYVEVGWAVFLFGGLNLAYYLNTNHTYIGFLVGVPDKISRLAHRYNPGRLYYFYRTGEDFRYILFCVIAFLGFNRFSLEALRKMPKAHANIVFTCFTTLGLASCVSWKFARILIQFYPLFLLASIILLYAVKPKKTWLGSLILLLSLFSILPHMKSELKKHRLKLQQRYSKESAQVDYVNSIRFRNAIVIGGPRTQKEIVRSKSISALVYFPKIHMTLAPETKEYTKKSEWLEYFKKQENNIILRNLKEKAKLAISEIPKYKPVYYNSEYTFYVNTDTRLIPRKWKIPLLQKEETP